MSAGLSKTLQKAMQLLTLVGASEKPVRLDEIVKRSRQSKTVCFRLLATLEKEGMVVHTKRDGYLLGPKLVELAGWSLNRNALRRHASPILERIVRQTGDTVLLFIHANESALCVDRRDGDAPVRPSGADIGGRLNLHTGAAPFVLLSFLPLEQQDAFLSRPLAKITSKTVIDPRAIRKTIEKVRRIGLAVGDEDAIDHVVAIGAPIFDVEGDLVGAVSVGGIKQRFTLDRMREVAAILRDAAVEITTRLGGTYPTFSPDTWEGRGASSVNVAVGRH
jgi:DNA-binding IclR family transcriptional regulator